MIKIPVFLCLLLLALVKQVCADGGVVLFSQTAGLYRITLFASPAPVRIGENDFSVLLQEERTGTPLLDAQVQLELEGPNAQVLQAKPNRQEATNKLLYAAPVTLSRSGTWTARITCRRNNESIWTKANIPVLPEEGALRTYWPYFAVVPLGIGLFFLHGHLREQRKRLK